MVIFLEQAERSIQSEHSLLHFTIVLVQVQVQVLVLDLSGPTFVASVQSQYIFWTGPGRVDRT